jgi:hypothetical protein
MFMRDSLMTATLAARSPRISTRFPNLSSDGWVDVRRDRKKAKRIFESYQAKLSPLSVFTALTLTLRVELVALVGRLDRHLWDWAKDRDVRDQLKKISERGIPSCAETTVESNPGCEGEARPCGFHSGRD